MLKRHEIQVLRRAGHSLKEVVKLAGVSQSSVQRVAAEPPVMGFDSLAERVRRAIGRPSKAGAFRALLVAELAKQPNVRGVELLRRARDAGYAGGKSALYELIAAIRPREAARPLVRFEGLPGEFSQHDFGEVDVEFGNGTARRVHFFASRLKYSRWAQVSLVDDERVEALVRSLVDHFAAMGGIPLLAVFDRPKTVALAWRRDGVVTEWNPTFAGVALDLGLGIELCWPYSPRQKGAVENLVGWVKGSFFKQRRFFDEEDLRRQLAEWHEEVNVERPSRATGVTDRRKGAGDDRRNGASFGCRKRASRQGLRVRVFGSFCNRRFGHGGAELRGAVGSAVEHEAVGVVAHAVEGGRSEQAVGGEGLIPLVEVEVGGDDRGRGLVALGDEIVEVLVGGRSQGFQAEVVDDQQRHAGERGEFALVAAGRSRGVEARGEACAGAEDDIDAGAHGAVAKRLRQVRFPGAAGADDEHRGLLGEVAAGGEVVHQGAVQLRQALEVELLERLGGAKGRASEAQGELLLFAPCDLVLDEKGQELGVGELGIDRLAVSRLQRIEDARQTQLFQLRGDLRNGVHGRSAPCGLG